MHKITSFRQWLEQKGVRFKWHYFYCGFAIFVALSIVPLLLLAPYNFPSTDDFGYGALTRAAWLDTNSVFAVLSAALKETLKTYTEWQGSYSAVFLMSLQPAVFNASLYSIVPFLTLGLLCTGIITFCYSFLGHLMKVDKWTCLFISSILIFFSVQMVPSPVEAFYWYNGSIYYTGFFSFSLILVSLMLHLLQAETFKKQLILHALLPVFALFVAGGNYINTPLLALVFILFMFLAIRNRKKWKRLIPTFICYTIGFCLNIFAPGNQNREVLLSGRPSFLKSILRSFRNSFVDTASWMNIIFVISLIFLAFAFWISLKNTTFAFRYPVLVTILSICFLAAGYFPPIYMMNSAVDGRLSTSLYFTFLLLSVINIFYWAGWVCLAVKNYTQKNISLYDSVLTWTKKNSFFILTSFTLAFLSILFIFVVNDRIVYSSTSAILSLRSNEASTYAQEMQQRLSVLEDADVEDAVISSLTSKPHLLFLDEITEDPSNWKNQNMAAFYQKKSVRIEVLK